MKSCGYIASPGFPTQYNPTQQCSWKITVDTDYYIKLMITDFQVFEDKTPFCGRDYMAVIDVDKSGKETELGRFCDTFKPPNIIYSSWNMIGVNFFSDRSQVGKGFTAKYEQVLNKVPEGLTWDETASGNNKFFQRYTILNGRRVHIILHSIYKCLYNWTEDNAPS